ncbi:MAG: hypothetical protein KatS3mg104_1378 [Phycisphaerae bacterium]|jgi:cell division protein FtsL|nr:MAG: hypothetical protein KatS3mg104_1378 [Phycisphaerae bacterium]
MDSSRKEAPSFDLSAKTSEDENVLQVGPEDLDAGIISGQKKKPEIKAIPPDPDLEAKLFNALVSPVAPVRLNDSSVSAHEPTPASPEPNVPPPLEKNEPPEADPTEDRDLTSKPILVIRPSSVETGPTVHDWEPLPPPMRIARETDTSANESVPVVAQEQDVEESVSTSTPSKSIPRTRDPAEAEVQTSPASESSVSSRYDRFDQASSDPTSKENPEASLGQSTDDPSTQTDLSDLGPVSCGNAVSRTGAWWTLPMMCLGLTIIACALIVPAVDENRRELHQLTRLERDVNYFQMQSEVNKQFLEHVSTDPALAERLAMRQLRMTRPDSRIVQIPQTGNPFAMSPYALVTLDPPPPVPDYQPLGGVLSRYFLDPQTQIYLTGIGILLTAAGVILGGGQTRPDQAA